MLGTSRLKRRASSLRSESVNSSVAPRESGVPMSSAANPVSTSVLTLPKAILWGGLVAGVLDAVDGVVAFGTKGLNPIQVLQYIASGLLGPSSFQGNVLQHLDRSEEHT